MPLHFFPFRTLAQRLENSLQSSYMLSGLFQVILETLPQVVGRRRLRHLGEGFYELIFSVVQIS